MCNAGVAGDFYSIVTDEEHNVNGQFVKRGQRLSENGETWMDLPTLQDKATWLGAFGIIYKGDTVDMQRAEDHSVTGEHALLVSLKQQTGF